MADELVLFQAGQKITAEETNDNNRYLLSVAQDTSGELQNYIDTQLTNFQNTLNTQISSINAQISAVSAAANSKIAASQIKNPRYGYCKFSNGIILQWGRLTITGGSEFMWIIFPTPYTTNTASVIVQQNYDAIGQWSNGQMTKDISTTGFSFSKNFGSNYGGEYRWLSIGY